MTIYAFTGPKVTRRLTGKCPKCDKRVTRSCQFEHTVNPFNRHPTEDRPKTWAEVSADVNAKADAWRPDFTCQACQSTEGIQRVSVDTLISWIRSECYKRYSHNIDHKVGRAKLCNERISAYVVRVLELEPDRIDWPTACYYDRDEHELRYTCYYEFEDGHRCIYGKCHGAGHHLSSTGQRVDFVGREVAGC